MRPKTNTVIQSAICLATLLICIKWYRDEGGYEPLIGILAAVAGVSALLVTDGSQERLAIHKLHSILVKMPDLLPNLGQANIETARKYIVQGIVAQIILAASYFILEAVSYVLGINLLSQVSSASMGSSFTRIFQFFLRILLISPGVASFGLFVYGVYLWVVSGISSKQVN